MTLLEDTYPSDLYLRIFDEEYGKCYNDKLELRLEKPMTHKRSWKTLYETPYLKSMNFNQDHISIECKTRSEPTSLVPERMFSSLKYTIELSLPISFFGKETLMTQIQVVDHCKPQEEINKEGRSIFKGTSSLHPFSISPGSKDQKCKIKFQFNDSSFHYNKKNFAFKISVIHPNLLTSLLVVLSPPFKVYARRPQAKRKEMEKENEGIQVKKVKKESNDPDKFQDFQQSLGNLVKIVDCLNDDQKREAIDSIKKNFKIEDQYQTPSFDIFKDLIENN